MNELTRDATHSYRRFKDGEGDWCCWNEKIFTAGWSHKCPTYVHRTPPCQAGCPSGHDIRGWLAIVRGQDKPVAGKPWQKYAFERMVEANPFPAVMGRVCPAPCQEGCNRNEVEDFVGINAVEHFIGDWAIENGLKLPAPGPDTGKKVAVVGGGPAGLAAAYFLRRRGHAVVVFEANAKLGGMMRYGIPEYRVPRRVLDVEIQRILDMGVEARTGVKVGVDVTVAQLERDFDAIFWGIGAQAGRPLPVPGWEGTSNCLTGVDFLRAFNEDRLQFAPERLIVVGGGDTSIDVASVARRIGHIRHPHASDVPENAILGFTAHDVARGARREGVRATLTSLFPIENMTAAEREREDAMSEGVELKGGVMPLEVLKDAAGRARGLRLCQCDMNGTTPVPRPGTEFEIEADLIVSAIGQMGLLADGLADLDNGRGFVDADKVYGVKGRPKHFAGGDIVRPHLLTTAIGQGSIAVESIDAFLSSGEIPRRPRIDTHHFRLLDELRQRGLDPEPFTSPTRGTSGAKFAVHNYEDRADQEVISHEELFLGHFANVPRNRRTEIHIKADEVLGNFSERLVAYDETQVVAEAKRCMSCGMCFECDNCVVFCPQTAVFRVGKDERAIGRYVATDYTKCIGCHICKDVCPTGYIQMGLGE